ncbi:hypothetical protein H072_5136 [Dactylellina haptotyla CBS 200.50]|uniref:Uncharacterized protein n=1 Tax=Dactylellina haptotyla (strain CBS 200.50) TaxID=1284197 RepID=S8C060_DACHA|nr:hypothetical protein H072_5136 [Dactylellina haptotyla CBS 200.50]
MEDAERATHCIVQELSSIYPAVRANDGMFNFEGVIDVAGGERVALKNPQKFFDQEVLTNQQARLALSLWLSAAESMKYQFSKDFDKPKIWVLTGLYSLSEGENKKNCLVWAARFQMLDLRGAGRCDWGNSCPRSIPLSRIGTGIPDGGDDTTTQPIEFVCVHEPNIDYHLIGDGLYTAPIRRTSSDKQDQFVEDLISIEDTGLIHYPDESDTEYYDGLLRSIEKLRKEWRDDRQVYLRLNRDGERYRKLIAEDYESTLVDYVEYCRRLEAIKHDVIGEK